MLLDIYVGDYYIFGLVYIYVFYLMFLQLIHSLFIFIFNNCDIIFYPIFHLFLNMSTYDIKLFLYIVSHIVLNCYYIL